MAGKSTQYGGGTQLIAQPNFARSIDVTSADFDGTDLTSVIAMEVVMSATMRTQETNGSKFNPWKKNGGFIYKPSADGEIDVLTWEDYERNGKVVDDTLMQTIYSTGTVWEELRVVKIYDSSTVKTFNIGQVL